MTNQPLVVDLSSGTSRKKSSGTLRFGGKADSLNTLLGAGFPVPRTYCVTVEAYNEFMEASGLSNKIESFDAKNADTCLEIQKSIERAELPKILRAAIVQAYKEMGRPKVAVRSSGINEDGASLSFAGQYDTFLYVEGDDEVVDCVKRCWKSLWASRAQEYQSHNTLMERYSESGVKNTGNKPEKLDRDALAVVVQEMIDADVAGVLFTADPITGDSTCSVIDACWGVGEGVVSGQVTTDTYIVKSDDFTIIERKIRKKPSMSCRSANGLTSLRETPSGLLDKPTLSDEQVKKLASYADEIRELYGKELDIEWAIKNDKVWILQARPITVTKADNRIYADCNEKSDTIRNNSMFSRLDVGEIVTGLMTPLGLSFCRFYQYNIHGPAVKTMGLLDIGDPQHYMGYLQGHVYLNISASAQLLTQCPPTRDMMKFTRRYASEDIDFSNYENPYGKPFSGFKYFKSSLYWFGYQVHNIFTAKKTVKKMNQLRERETLRFLKLDLASMSLAQLDKELERIDAYFLESCAAYMPFFLQSFALYDTLADLCNKWLKSEGNGLQNQIKSSMNNLRTIEVTRAICNLTEQVNSSVSLRKLFLQTPVRDLIEKLQKNEEGRKFWEEDFADFLQNFGSRGHQEFDLSLMRWSDDPTYLLQVIRTYLVSDVQLELRLKQTEQKRDKDSQVLLAKLPFKVRMTFKFVIAAYAKMAERREAIRPTFITETWFYRKIIVEVMKRLMGQGVVSIDDLPFIDFNKFRDYMSGRELAEDAFSSTIIEKNRRQHQLNQYLAEPPLALIGGYEPVQKDIAEVSCGEDGVINGLSASPGVVIARARVITDLAAQVEEFKQGEILVARFTDASWTPLFVLASGVIADIGSILSHSSIVSREFGIPAVVNTRNATMLIKTGDLLYLDGNSGVVRIKEKAIKK